MSEVTNRIRVTMTAEYTSMGKIDITEEQLEKHRVAFERMVASNFHESNMLKIVKCEIKRIDEDAPQHEHRKDQDWEDREMYRRKP